jgi:hypothetical protein
MKKAKKNYENMEKQGTMTLPCGCQYLDKGWLLTRIRECEHHMKKRTTKKPYRPKAECVRP